MAPPLVLVAKIGAAHGLRGEVRLTAFGTDPQALLAYGDLVTEGGRVLRLTRLDVRGNGLVARFAGIGDRTAAEGLQGLDLHVPRDRLPAPDDPETFYQADLLGLTAVGPGGDVVGRVTALHDFGAGDIIEIAPGTGGPGVMLPFARAFVPEVDIAGGRIVLSVDAMVELAAKGGAPDARP